MGILRHVVLGTFANVEHAAVTLSDLVTNMITLDVHCSLLVMTMIGRIVS